VGTVSPLQIVRRTDVNAAVVQLKKIYVLQSTYAKAQGGVPGEIRTHDPRIRNGLGVVGRQVLLVTMTLI
jgi:hypothetical protein